MNSTWLPSRCRYCKHYTPVGRRGGSCQRLSVPVQATWTACQLADVPFEPTWQDWQTTWAQIASVSAVTAGRASNQSARTVSVRECSLRD